MPHNQGLLIRLLTSPLRILDEIRLVAAWDMTRQARRPSFFLMRMALAGFVAFQIVMIWWGQIEERRWRSGTGNDAVIPINQIVFAIERIFSGSVLVMSIGLVLFCPALTSGTIAGDRERKIWHDLANSPLSGWSILMGKLVARLATVFAWILVAMPLWALLSLIGGLDPRAISLIMLGLFLYGWFYAALGLLASVATRRSRDALGLVTAFVSLLIFVPLVAPELLREVGLGTFFLRDAIGFFKIFDPVLTVPDIPRWLNRPGGTGAFSQLSLPRLYLVIGVAAPALTLLAGLLLRPLGRRLDSEGQASHSRKRAGFPMTVAEKFGQGLRDRSEGLADFALARFLNEPMIAKERRVRPGSRLTRVLRRLALSFYFGTTLAILLYNLPSIILELLQYGLYSRSRRSGEVIEVLTLVTTFCTAILLQYGIMLDAAGRLVMEKEQDTWTTLLSTPLQPHEILLGKAFGAFWGWRWALLHLAFIWLVALAVGAMSPVGLVRSLLIWPIQLGLMTALGLRIGMNSAVHATVVSKCIGVFIVLQVLLPILASWFVRDDSALLTQQAITAVFAAGVGFRNGPNLLSRSLGFGILWQFLQILATFFLLLEVYASFERKTIGD